MENKTLKAINQVIFSGKIYHKHLKKEEKILYITVNAVNRKGDKSFHNRPEIFIEGEEAEYYNNLFETGDMITVMGHMEIRTNMRYIGKRTYKQVWQSYLIPDTIYRDDSWMYLNSVVIAGEIKTAYRYKRKDAGLYLLTVKTITNEEKPVVASVIVFDRHLENEPAVGDYIIADCGLRTNVETYDIEGKEAFTDTISIIAEHISLTRKNKPAEKHVRPPFEDASPDENEPALEDIFPDDLLNSPDESGSNPFPDLSSLL